MSETLEERVAKLEQRLDEIQRAPAPASTERIAMSYPALVDDPGSVVVEIVANWFGITPEQIMSRGRPEHIAWPRQIAIFLLSEHTEWSSQKVGDYFGRDHANVLYACRKVVAVSEVEPRTAETLLALSAQVKKAIRK